MKHSDGIWKFVEKITRNLAVQDKFNTQDTGTDNRHISVSFYFHSGNVLWQQRLHPFNRRIYKTSLTVASFCSEKLPRWLLSVIMNDLEFWFRPSRDDNFKCLDLTPLKYHLLLKIPLISSPENSISNFRREYYSKIKTQLLNCSRYTLTRHEWISQASRRVSCETWSSKLTCFRR